MTSFLPVGTRAIDDDLADYVPRTTRLLAHVATAILTALVALVMLAGAIALAGVLRENLTTAPAMPQGGSAGRETIVDFVVDDVTATPIELGGTSTSWECNNPSATHVYRVNAGATSITSAAIGPYCATCSLGQRFALPTQRVYVLADGATPTITCSRLLDGATHSAAGGGISLGMADQRYLSLATADQRYAPIEDGHHFRSPLVFEAEATWGTVNYYSRNVSISASGTQTTYTPNHVNFYLSRPRQAHRASSLGAPAHWGVSFSPVGPQREVFGRGDGPGTGGGYVRLLFGLGGANALARTKCQIGMTCFNPGLQNLNNGTNQPSGQTCWFGVGFDSLEEKFAFMHNDLSGTSTKVPLDGLTAPSTTRNSAWYQLELFWPPNATSVEMRMKNLTTGLSETYVATSNLPPVDRRGEITMRCGNDTSIGSLGDEHLDVRGIYFELPGEPS